MKPIARVGDQHVCGNPKHPPSTIVSGGEAIVEGQVIARVGDSCGCGAVIVQGSSYCKDTGQPIAYIGSATQCGSYSGKIVSGASQSMVLE